MKQPIELSTLPRDQAEQLADFARILGTRAVALGFIAEGDRTRVLERHVLDSCRAVRCVPSSARVVVDIGSGAGLPGVPVAILLPTVQVVLIEPRQKRAAFLESVVNELILPNVEVLAVRAEDAVVWADAALARALGDVLASWERARPLLTDDGCLVYFAGASWNSADADRLGEAGGTATICDAARAVGGGPLVVIRRAATEPPTVPDSREH